MLRKKYAQKTFKNEVNSKLTGNIDTYFKFEEIFVRVLAKHAPLTKKKIRANYSSYMVRALQKAIMKRTSLYRKYFKTETLKDFASFKKQINFCSNLYKKEKRKYYENLDMKNVTDNTKFWKTVVSFYSDKTNSPTKVYLKKYGKIFSEDYMAAEELSSFSEIVVEVST